MTSFVLFLRSMCYSITMLIAPEPSIPVFLWIRRAVERIKQLFLFVVSNPRWRNSPIYYHICTSFQRRPPPTWWKVVGTITIITVMHTIRPAQGQPRTGGHLGILKRPRIWYQPPVEPCRDALITPIVTSPTFPWRISFGCIEVTNKLSGWIAPDAIWFQDSACESLLWEVVKQCTMSVAPCCLLLINSCVWCPCSRLHPNRSSPGWWVPLLIDSWCGWVVRPTP